MKQYDLQNLKVKQDVSGSKFSQLVAAAATLLCVLKFDIFECLGSGKGPKQ